MADMCEVTYKLAGDRRAIKTVYEVLRYMERRKTAVVKNRWGKMWLGCMVNRLGGDCEACGCRGVIVDYWYEGDDEEVLTIVQETEWREQAEVRAFLERVFPKMKVYYLENRSGLSAVLTNDEQGRYFEERYFVDSYEDWYFFSTIDEVAEFAEEVTRQRVAHDIHAVYRALMEYSEAHEDEWYEVREVERG